MIKKILITLLVIIGTLFILSKFGFQLGNVTIGKVENNLKVNQINSLEDSEFQKKYLNNNKIICINLWATWCVPCIEEMPALNEIKKKYKNKNIEFISFSLDSDSIRMKKFINTNKFEFKDVTLENLKYKNSILNFLENKPLNCNISSQTIPITYLIKNKKIIKKFDGLVDEKELIFAIENSINLK